MSREMHRMSQASFLECVHNEHVVLQRNENMHIQHNAQLNTMYAVMRIVSFCSFTIVPFAYPLHNIVHLQMLEKLLSVVIPINLSVLIRPCGI